VPNLTETHNILQTIGHQPKKKLGQNFLIDNNIVDKIIKFSAPKEGYPIVEIGPGLGVLTEKLIENKSIVYAIEKDRNLFNYLISNLQKNHPLSLFIKQGDCLHYPIANLPEKYFKHFDIISNLPYAITTPWLDLVLQGPLPNKMTLMLQKEAADRLLAKPNTKHFSTISIILQSTFDCVDKHKVSRNCFYPKPNIDSIVICLAKKDTPYLFSQNTRNLIRYFFSHRRKQMGSLIKSKESSYPALKDWIPTLEKEKHTLKSRPEELSIKEWKALNELLDKD